MKFQRETYSQELVDEMTPLFFKHYLEIATFKDIPLSPDLSAYERVNAAGNLRIYTARQENKLIGYDIIFVNYNPHYRTSFQANRDILYLDRGYRMGMTGYKFIKWSDEQLQKEGIQVIYTHIKNKFDFSRMIHRLGYVDHDIVLARRLN